MNTDQFNTVKTNLFFYVVVNAEGKFFRSRGYGRHTHDYSWTNDITKAKIYNKITPARGQVTYWYSNFPTYGMLSILKLSIGEIEVIDEKNRVERAIAEKQRREEEKNARRILENIKDAERQLTQIQERLDNLKGKRK